MSFPERQENPVKIFGAQHTVYASGPVCPATFALFTA